MNDMHTLQPTGAKATSPSRRDQVRVAVHVRDPLARAGLLSRLHTAPELDVLDRPDTADVIVAMAEADLCEALHADTTLILLSDEPRLAGAWTAIEYSVVVVLPLRQAACPNLVRAVINAKLARRRISPEQFVRVANELSRLREAAGASHGPAEAVLNTREVDIVRRLADGKDTEEIAAETNYSERTIKNILHGMMSRLGLKNRTHAVAYAIQQGYA